MSRVLLFRNFLNVQINRLNVQSQIIKFKHLHWKNVCGKTSCRHISHKTHKNTNVNEKYTSFSELINFRKEEAKRSIIVQVQSAQSFKELYAYCNQFGKVNHMFHYTSGVEPLHFILIEFDTEVSVQNVLSSSCHIEDNQAVPVKSPFLWFRISNTKKLNTKMPKSFKLTSENGTKLLSNENIIELIQHSKNISDQMNILYNLTKLNDLGFRLRFLTARQIELALSGLFPEAVAFPFGSSINGYGKLGCDLDLILKLNGDKELPNSRLVYQCKAGFGNERTQSQRHMEAIGDMLHLFLPGCSQVRRILQARVPILKYNQQFTDIECDLSMTNMIALRMSEILYLLGSIDDRVRPLVFTIRKWAYEVGLTSSSPGRWITNFSLTLLVLAFLQKYPLSNPILPSLNKVFLLKGNSNSLENDLNCKFLQDINQIKVSEDSASLETLLHQFFEYYSNFDFNIKAVSLNEAAVILKPEHHALYIVNPIERGLNVSKNVSLEELERLKIELRNAAWILESQDKKIGKWGILSIFQHNNKSSRNFYSSARNNRIMEVKKLFEDNLEETNNEEYKNKNIRQQVANIKVETKKSTASGKRR